MMDGLVLLPMRALGTHRTGGHIIPFGVRDKFGTWWDKNTDLALHLYRDRPLFVQHLNLPNVFGRAGTVDSSTFRVDVAGFYAEAEYDGQAHVVAAAMELQNRQRAAFSTAVGIGRGSQSIRKSDLYVERWAWLELSVADMDVVISPMGTTTAHLMRAGGVANGGILELDDRAFREQRIFDMASAIDRPVVPVPPAVSAPPAVPAPPPPTSLQHVVPPAPPPPAPPPAPPAPPIAGFDMVALAGVIQTAVDTALDAREGMRALPPGGVLPVGDAPMYAASPYDDVDALTMLVWGHMRSVDASLKHRQYQHDDVYMRALNDKLRVWQKETEGLAVPLPSQVPTEGAMAVPMRALDHASYQAWDKVIPGLRANEAAQSTLASFGDELVPTALESALWLFFRMESKVLGLFPMFDMPSNPFEYPTITQGFRLQAVGELQHRSQMSIPTSPIESVVLNTGKVTFNAGELGALMVVSRVILEDSGVNLAAEVVRHFMRETVASIDDHLINGDEQADANNISHSADPTGTVYSGYLKFNGMRRLANAADSGNDFAAHATISEDTPATLAKLMGTRGIIGRDIANLALLCDPGSAYKYDALTKYETADSVGERATLLTGQVGSVKGVPIIVSDEIQDATAAGLYPENHTSGTTGTQVLVHRPGILIGRRRNEVLESVAANYAGGHVWWLTLRMDVQQMEDGHVVTGYNTTI